MHSYTNQLCFYFEREIPIVHSYLTFSYSVVATPTITNACSSSARYTTFKDFACELRFLLLCFFKSAFGYLHRHLGFHIYL
jgi:hypothetical protein